MTTRDRAESLALVLRQQSVCKHNPSGRCIECDVIIIMAQIREAVEEATAKDQAEIEDLIWNLAGCSTFAMGYGIDEPFDQSKARAAIHDVLKLALKYRTAKADAYETAAKIAEHHADLCDCEGQEQICGFVIQNMLLARAAEVDSKP